MGHPLCLEEVDLSCAMASFPIPIRGLKARSCVIPTGFPEATLFALLKGLFGAPTGMMSIALGTYGDPDAPFKYEFFIKLPDETYLSVVRSWLNLEVRRFGGGEVTVQAVTRMFTRNFDLHAEVVRKSLDDLERYRLVINPHYRHLKMMKYFNDILKKTNVKPPVPPAHLVNANGEKHAKELQKYMKAMEEQNCIATAVVMESAYAAESFLNLTIAMLQNQTLRSNPKIREEALRESWKDKILRLPLHCVAITRPPSDGDPPLKAIETVFRLRNKIAHSYPDPDDLCAEKIWFDQRIPILPRAESYVRHQCGVDELLPRRQEALACPPKVEDFIEYLLSRLDDQTRKDLSFFAKSNPIGYSEKTERFGIPFGGSIVMVGFGGRKRHEKGTKGSA